jgi:DNA-binding MarR family transcriptional regulator
MSIASIGSLLGARHGRDRSSEARAFGDRVSKFDHTEIDDVIHGRLRLGIMAYLSTVSPAPFVELKGKVNATDGNLSTHLSKLEEAEYVRIEKTFSGKSR